MNIGTNIVAVVVSPVAPIAINRKRIRSLRRPERAQTIPAPISKGIIAETKNDFPCQIRGPWKTPNENMFSPSSNRNKLTIINAKLVCRTCIDRIPRSKAKILIAVKTGTAITYSRVGADMLVMCANTPHIDSQEEPNGLVSKT